jgi:ATP-dependent RNA helicase DDX54/DBP10
MEMKNQNAKDDEASATLGVDESLKRKKKGSSGGGFESMGLSEAVYQGVKKIGFRVPTPVQRQALPICLSGKDAVVMARTGSGKTAAFVLAILERMLAREQQYGDGASGSSVRALILSPTRELALQTLRVTQILASFTSFISVGIVGGDSIESQFSALSKRPHLLVATPGRLSHLLREIPDFTLENCYTLVLDEGDRLMEMGFLAQVREICAKMPSSESRQTMLFSATMPKSLVEFTRSGVVLGDDPAIVRLEKDVNVSEELRLGFITCRSDEKDAALLHLVRDVCSTLPKIQHMSSASGSTDDNEGDDVSEKKNNKSNSPKGLILIFAATRHHVEYLTTLLRLHSLRSTQIYGAMDQEARQAALSSFRRGITPILVVTDVAARGIDVPLIDVVIHHSFPPSAKLFVHRSGRAARGTIFFSSCFFCLAFLSPY